MSDAPSLTGSDFTAPEGVERRLVTDWTDSEIAIEEVRRALLEAGVSPDRFQVQERPVVEVNDGG